jgi:hypothetical protein
LKTGSERREALEIVRECPKWAAGVIISRSRGLKITETA